MTEQRNDALDAARYRWWREHSDFLAYDGDGIEGCAFDCQIPMDKIANASHAELMDIVADFHLPPNNQGNRTSPRSGRSSG